jgi:hypothetical protein
MRYSLLAIGFISMVMSSSVSIGSALWGPEENAQMEKRIFKKASQKDFDVKSLSKEEKEWLYETDLLRTLPDDENGEFSNSEDISRTLGQLADFYNYKGRSDLAHKRYIQQAERDLKDALRGDEATLGIFNCMIKKNRLKDKYFKEIIRLYQQEPDEFANGKYKHLIKEDGFKDHVASLVGAYKESGKETLKLRKQKNGECSVNCVRV